jgi:assimilatory nitrate reductase catalytic subunit
MTALAVKFGRRLDLTGLANLAPADYDALTPRRWPVSSTPGGAEPFHDGRFPTLDGRARFVPTAPRGPRHAATDEFPLVLNTGRVRDQWHTMTRTARAPQLNAHEPEPYADLHPDDARGAGIEPGQLAQLVTRWGRMIVRARCSGDVARGSVFAPMHWNDCHTMQGRVGALVNPVVDAVSGEPEFKHTPVRVERYVTEWQGFLLSRVACELPKGVWWARAPGPAHQRYEIAGQAAQRPDARWFRHTFDGTPGGEVIEYEDERAGIYRAALMRAGRLEACLVVGPRASLPSREWLGDLFAAETIGDDDRLSLLTGRPAGARVDAGPIVCACFRVGRNTIVAAIEDGHSTLAEVGQCTRAGTNCGSCRPEIGRLIAAFAAPKGAVA